jgi:hypothetical protein
MGSVLLQYSRPIHTQPGCRGSDVQVQHEALYHAGLYRHHRIPTLGLSMASEPVPAYAHATITLVRMVIGFRLAVIPEVVTYDGMTGERDCAILHACPLAQSFTEHFSSYAPGGGI